MRTKYLVSLRSCGSLALTGHAARWIAAIAGGIAMAIVMTGAPAWAHVEVTADNPQPGATNVTLTFTGEAESTTAGIKSEQIFLPAGITPAQVKLAKAPAGWTLSPGTDNVTVAGPALPTGTDAVVSLVVAKLPPDATELVFKTIETYGDGEIVRWIEESQPGQPEPDHPAPVLKLTGASPAPADSPQPVPTLAGTPTTTAAAAPASSGSPVGWIVLVVVVLAVAGGAYYFLRRRRA